MMPDVSTTVKGRVFLLMGGTTGLGFSAARKLVASGARVYLVGRSQTSLDQALEQLGEGAAAGMKGDASEPRTSAWAVETAAERFGRLDGLYHVAGGSGRSKGDGPLHDLTDEGWRYTVDTNLSSVIYSNRSIVRHFLAEGTGGVILNMSSVLGFSPSPGFFATHGYAAAKAGIIGFSRSIAASYADKNIRVNVIAPALVETPMSERARQDEAILKFVKTKQPLEGGRMGLPEDYDEAVMFLLGEGSRFMTGQVLTVDGGWTISEGQYGGGGDSKQSAEA